MNASWMKSGLFVALVAAGCGTASPTQPTNGKVLLNLGAKASQPNNALAYSGGTCATFTFAPYSLVADGTATAAGEAVTFTTTADPTGTVAIAGCLDTIAGTATDHTQDDWEYMVTATSFHPCDGSLAALTAAGGAILPVSVFAVVKLNCQKGIDVAADVTVDVSVTMPNNAGYTDIGATINETEIDVGCKKPDPVGATGIYKFGESWVGTSASAQNGLWGYTANVAGTAFQQWSGQSGTAAITDQYYTGTVDTTTSEPYVLQTFVPTCVGAVGNNFYSGTSIAACVIDRGTWASGSVLATLIEAFEQTPNGWAAATIDHAAGQINIDVSTTVNLIALGATPTAHGNGANNVITRVPFAAADVGGTLQGIYPFHGGGVAAKPGFAVTYLSSTGSLPSWATIEFNGSTWAKTHSGTIAGATTAKLTCLGLYSTNDDCYDTSTCGASL